MRAPRILKSIGATVLPSAILLAGCPNQCAPAAAPAPAPAVAGAPTPAPAGAQFFASFDNPNEFSERFQTEVFFGRDGNGVLNKNSSFGQWQGDHDASCGVPTSQRTVHSDGQHDAEFYWYCAPGGDPAKGHVMTSMFTAGYAQVDFAPKQVFNNITRICYDRNLTAMSRKWIQVVVIPEATFQANGGVLHYARPDLLDGPAAGALPVNPGWMVVDDHASMSQVINNQWGEDYHQPSTTDDKAARYTTCISDLGNGTLRFEQDVVAGTIDSPHRDYTMSGALPDGPVRVIFQDDTYDSADHGTTAGQAAGADPRTTWHWDNIAIS